MSDIQQLGLWRGLPSSWEGANTGLTRQQKLTASASSQQRLFPAARWFSLTNSAVGRQLQVGGSGRIDWLSAETGVCLREFSFRHVLFSQWFCAKYSAVECVRMENVLNCAATSPVLDPARKSAPGRKLSFELLHCS